MMFFVLATALLFGACSAQGPVEVNDYTTFVEYLSDGYFGIVDIDLARCIVEPPLPNPGTLTFKIYYGSRYLSDDGSVDYAVSDYYFISSSAFIGVTQLNLDSNGFITLEYIQVNVPGFTTSMQEQIVCALEQGARLLVYGTELEVREYTEFTQVEDAFKAGIVASVHVDGNACASGLENTRLFAYAQDWRLYNEGTSDVLIDFEISNVLPIISSEGEEVNVYGWNRVLLTPDNAVTISVGYWEPDGTVQEINEYKCQLGTSVTVKSLGVELAQRYEDFNEIEALLLRGQEAYIYFNTANCELDPNGDDIFGNITLDQRRYVTEWSWLADVPGPDGRGIQSNFFFWSYAGRTPSIVHENIDISENGTAFIHASLINIATQESQTSLLECPLGEGLWFTTLPAPPRNQILDVQEFIDASRRGDPLDLLFYTDRCASSAFVPQNIIGTYIRSSASDSSGNDFIYFAFEMGLDFINGEGFTFTTTDVTMNSEGTFTLTLAIFDAGNWINMQPLTLECPFSAVVIFN